MLMIEGDSPPLVAHSSILPKETGSRSAYSPRNGGFRR